MASKPGILTDWPWTPLGSYKHVVLAPWVIHSIYRWFSDGDEKRDLANFLILPFMLWRMLHNQLWISFSRHRNAKGNNRIVDKGIEFEQVDRERNWDDQIILNAFLFYIFNNMVKGASYMPLWRTEGVVMTVLLHSGPVEFLYYWLHRALHHHFLYSRYHSHHHSSIVTEPITSVVHPFAEHISYFILFAIPTLTSVLTGTASIASIFGYITYIDFMNNMGHCNFELVPHSLFSIFPPLKYFMYTPSYHSLHHTQFRTNYSLFMPLYDYLYNTMDKSTDKLYEASLIRGEEDVDVMHLTHLTTPDSIYHLGFGFASLASKPYRSLSTWYLWPLSLWSFMLTSITASTFVVERQQLDDTLKLQTWAIPKYNLHFLLRWQRRSINRLIEKAILDADAKGVKVVSLGLMNQGEELNQYGGLYVKKHPKLKVKVVDGSSLAVAVVLNTIPKDTTQVLLRGHLTKVAYALAFALCQKGIQVTVIKEDEFVKLKRSFNGMFESNLVLSKSCSKKIWVVGDGLTEEQQWKAPRGTVFIPFSQFPVRELRKDCSYHMTPAMATPPCLANVHSCENWLPRRAMSAWRAGGIVHALEGWEEHECGFTVTNIDKVWKASIAHGFQPLKMPTINT